MTRVKRGTIKHKRRERILKQTKGFRWGRKSKKSQAKEAILHKYSHAFRGRKVEKRTSRQLWNNKINAASRGLDTKYSELIHSLKLKNIELDRKVLADLAENNPDVFKKIVEFASSLNK